MLCQNCGEREAKVSITQIVNNKKTEIHLCPQCAQQSGHIDPVFGLHKMLASMMDWNPEKSQAKTCPGCGLTEQELHQNGRFGCEQCYETWAPLVEKILSRVQGRTTHTGKVPRSAGEKVKKERELGELRRQLEQAVAEERFEEAAQLRDKIRELEKQ